MNVLMSAFRYLLFSFWRNEKAATMIEYSLIVAVIAMVAVVGALALGAAIGDTFCDMAIDLDAASTCAG